MIKVPDAASYAAMFFLHKLIGKRTGPSTGTNLWGAFELIAEMAAAGEQGSVVTLICDSGERYCRPTTTTCGWRSEDRPPPLAAPAPGVRRDAAPGSDRAAARLFARARQDPASAATREHLMAKILLVEDNEMNRDMLSPAPGRKGYEVVAGGRRREGVDTPLPASCPI